MKDSLQTLKPRRIFEGCNNPTDTHILVAKVNTSEQAHAHEGRNQSSQHLWVIMLSAESDLGDLQEGSREPIITVSEQDANWKT